MRWERDWGEGEAQSTRRLPAQRFVQRCIISAILLGFTSTAGAAPITPQLITVACDLPPRAYEDLSTLLATPNFATPAATTAGHTLPAGTPASTAEKADIEQTVRQWLACQNAGQPLRAWALFSDGYLYRLLSRQGGLTATAFTGLATPTPAQGEPATLLHIADARQLPDGRLGATVTIAYPSVPMPKTFFFYFTKSDDRQLIDGILGEISFSVP